MKKFDVETISKAYDSGISIKVIDQLVNSLSDCEGVYGCDLHSRLFNEDLFFISIMQAESSLDELGTFNCIRLVFNYEKTHFGEVNIEIEPCKIANMVCYIMGEFIYKSKHLQNECWNRKLESKDLEIIESELQDYLESLTDDLSNVAFDEYNI